MSFWASSMCCGRSCPISLRYPVNAFVRAIAAWGSDLACRAASTSATAVPCATLNGVIAATQFRSPLFVLTKVVVMGVVTIDGVALGSLLMRRSLVIVGMNSSSVLQCAPGQVNRALQVGPAVIGSQRTGCTSAVQFLPTLHCVCMWR